MSRLRMISRDKPEHGLVRHITDPAELTRLGERYARDSVPCTGNLITVSLLGGRRNITYSDHDVSRLLDADAARPAEQRMSQKERNALIGFRRLLSKSGTVAFTQSQREFLHSLMRKAEKPRSRTELPPEVREQINRQIRAVFALSKDKDDKSASEQAVVEFFTPEVLDKIIQEVSDILEPYGLETEARDCVFERGKREVLFLKMLVNEHPVTEWGKKIFNLCLENKWMVFSNGRAVTNYELSEIPAGLRSELDGVPLYATEIAKDRLRYIITGGETIRGIAAGSMGSGKGGDGRGS